MRYSRPPGPALAVVLIISAIDVLLCSFTAGITLFVFSPSPPARAATRTAGQGRYRGGGADGVRIVISNAERSDLQHKSGSGLVASSPGRGVSVVRLRAMPSLEDPLWLGTGNPCRPDFSSGCKFGFDATVHVIRTGTRSAPISRRIRCVANHADVVAIVDAEDPVIDLCGPPPSDKLRAGLFDMLRQRRDQRDPSR